MLQRLLLTLDLNSNSYWNLNDNCYRRRLVYFNMVARKLLELMYAGRSIFCSTKMFASILPVLMQYTVSRKQSKSPPFVRLIIFCQGEPSMFQNSFFQEMLLWGENYSFWCQKASNCQKFSRTQNRILGPLWRLDDFLMKALIQGYPGTAQETSGNAYGTNQRTKEYDRRVILILKQASSRVRRRESLAKKKATVRIGFGHHVCLRTIELPWVVMKIPPFGIRIVWGAIPMNLPVFWVSVSRRSLKYGTSPHLWVKKKLVKFR